MGRKHLIIGDGVAGMSAAHAIRLMSRAGSSGGDGASEGKGAGRGGANVERGDSIVVVSEDPQPYYYRASLTNYLMGELSVGELDAMPAGAWEDLDIERLHGRVTGLDPKRPVVEIEGRGAVEFDRLLIATGARARRLETPEKDPRRGVVGADLTGVVVLRTYQDAQRVVEAARRARHAVVIGGGILGLEAVQGLRDRGLSVALVHHQPYLFEKVLDATAADLVRNRMRRAGVAVHVSSAAERIVGDAKGRVTEVVLTDGTRLKADLVLTAIGNQPNTDWLAGSGVEIGKDGTLPVDSEMRVRGRTNVFAAGDLVRYVDPESPWENPGGLWQPARKQGRVAGLNMAAGDAVAGEEYRPGVLYSATRAWDLDVGSLGYHVDDPRADDAREFRGPLDGPTIYKKAILRGGRLFGALLLGDRREGHAFRRLMNLSGPAADVSSIADHLFDPDFPLFAFVARQESASASAAWKKTVYLPKAPLPPSLVQRGRTVQRGLALGVRPATRLSGGVTGAIEIAHGKTDARFEGPTVRIGASRACDVRVDGRADADESEELVLTREGLAWNVVSTAGRRATGCVNGALLRGARELFDRDALELRGWRGVVRLRALAPGAAAVAAKPVASLFGLQRSDLLPRRTYSIGAARDNDIVLAGAGVSDHHAQLEIGTDAATCFLKDLASAAGTFVGSHRVTRPTRLAPGDTLRFGGGADGRGPVVALSFRPITGTPDEGPVVDPRAHPPSAEPVPAGPAGERSVLVFLKGVEGPLAGRVFAVPLGAVIGRGASADVRLDDPLVSSAHARLAGTASAPAIVDLGSANGVFVRGVRVEPDVRTALAEGDSIQLGRTRFLFSLKEPVGSRTPESPADEPAVGAEARRHTGMTMTVELREAGPRLVEKLPSGGVLPRLLGEKVVRLGRASDNTLVLPRPDISAYHAQLSLEHGAYVLQDLESKYETRVNHTPLRKGERRRLEDGDLVELASVAFTYAAGAHAPTGRRARAARLVPLDKERAAVVQSIALDGAGPFVLGRKPWERTDAALKGADVELPFGGVLSRVHAQIVRSGDGYAIRDLGSANGTFVGGVEVKGEPVALPPGATLAFGPIELRFEVEIEELRAPVRTGPKAEPARARRDTGFVIDGTAATANGIPLDRLVAEEVDSCIGCHDCMRACPLEEAATVSIGALNTFADGIGAPSETALAFVQKCTQCQACVPVCPVDIQRARIVLFNKLKPEAQPNEAAPITFQVGSGQAESRWTLAGAEAALSASPLLEPLLREQRIRLLSHGRWRRLAPGEILFAEGAYVDALWIVIEGRLSVVAELAGGRARPMTTLVAGQTAGETAVLSDQSAEFGVRAEEETTLVGLPKHALDALLKEKHVKPVEAGKRSFPELLESLYVGSTVEAHLRRLAALEGFPKPDKAVAALCGLFEAERYAAGAKVFGAEDHSTTFALVRRGFVKEIRLDGGEETVANYLKAGDAFGGADSGRRGTFVRYEASTKAEVLTVRVADLKGLDQDFPGLSGRLLDVAQLPGMDLTPEEAKRRKLLIDRGIAQGTEVLAIDTRICMGCDNCTSACERRHGHSRLDRLGTAQQIGPYQFAASCYHCDDPVCLLCAVEGIVREPTGEIRIVEDRCIGCGACAERCPFDNIQMVAREPEPQPLLQRLVPDPILRWLGMLEEEGVIDDPERVAVKCDLCVGYKDGPACVRACPVGAAQRVDPMNLFAGVRGDSASRGGA